MTRERDSCGEVVSRVLSGLAPVRVTVGYAIVLCVVGITLLVLGPGAQASVVSQMSTNLHNLARGRLGTLIGSAFVTDGDDFYLWLPGLVCLLALGELFWRSRHLVLAFAVGHVGATLLVGAGLAVAVQARWVPISIARASDVGISYGAAAVLGALAAVIPPRWRAGWVGWWAGLALAAASGADFTAVGHAVALTLGFGLSGWLRPAARWTAGHGVLLAGGVAFGYVVLTGAAPLAAPAGGLAGMLIALSVQGVSRRVSQWLSRRGTPAAVGANPAAG